MPGPGRCASRDHRLEADPGRGAPRCWVSNNSSEPPGEGSCAAPTPVTTAVGGRPPCGERPLSSTEAAGAGRGGNHAGGGPGPAGRSRGPRPAPRGRGWGAGSADAQEPRPPGPPQLAPPAEEPSQTRTSPAASRPPHLCLPDLRPPPPAGRSLKPSAAATRSAGGNRRAKQPARARAPRAKTHKAPRGARSRARHVTRPRQGRTGWRREPRSQDDPRGSPARAAPALSPLTFRTGRGGPQSASKPQVTPNVPRRRRSAGGGRESSPRAATQPRACAVRPQPRRAGGPGGESAVGRAGAAGWGAPWAPCAWGAKAGPQPRRRTSVARGFRRTAAPLSAHTLPAGRACAPPALQASGMW